MSELAIVYPTTEYLLRALGLENGTGFVIALCFFLLVAIVALTVGARGLNRKRMNR
jgi:hypothetical protein